MLRRDLLILVGIILCGLGGFITLSQKDSSEVLIKKFTLWLIILLCYLVLIIILSYVFPKFGKWGDKKIEL